MCYCGWGQVPLFTSRRQSGLKTVMPPISFDSFFSETRSLPYFELRFFMSSYLSKISRTAPFFFRFGSFFSFRFSSMCRTDNVFLSPLLLFPQLRCEPTLHFIFLYFFGAAAVPLPLRGRQLFTPDGCSSLSCYASFRLPSPLRDPDPYSALLISVH